MKILNLYAGIGGNRRLWQGHSVTAVEINEKIAAVYKANFPNDIVEVADARLYLLEHYSEFDFVWSSPPCQKHTRMIRTGRHPKVSYPDMSLYEQIIFLEEHFKGLWVVENVVPYYELLYPAVKAGRHLFWANFKIVDIQRHKNFEGAFELGKRSDFERFKKWLGIEFDGNLYPGSSHNPFTVLRNAVPPELGLHILNCAINVKDVNKFEQLTLF